MHGHHPACLPYARIFPAYVIKIPQPCADDATRMHIRHIDDTAFTVASGRVAADCGEVIRVLNTLGFVGHVWPVHAIGPAGMDRAACRVEPDTRHTSAKVWSVVLTDYLRDPVPIFDEFGVDHACNESK